MSRRPNPAADRAAQNQATLKSLVKLEGNKSCADCKRNKHPRWASWNLGIFICIRCSGIHRGMGTHISRVKSVDLDSWTDEQLQSMLRWGNARANKYWEAKLAPGHVPSEAKIENFIRTKYESKRWVMDGGMPDPATLDADADDDVPLNVVQEKAKMDRSNSQRVASTSSQPRQSSASRAPNIDLFGDDAASAPPRPSTTEPSITRPPPPKGEPAAPKQTKPGDSLLGLDFFGGTQSAPPPRSSTTTAVPNASVPSRPDLKQSILSLYASTPKPAAAPSQPHHQSSGSFGGLQSPPTQPPQPQQSAFGGLNDAFSGLSFASPSAQQPKPSPFAGLTGASQRSTAAAPSISGGGSFFDALPKATKPAAAPPPQQRSFSSSSGFGDFASATSPTSAAPPKPSAGGGMGDLFDFAAPAPQPSTPPKPPASQLSTNLNSAFNLSAPAPLSQPKAAPKPAPPSTANYSSGLSMDPWGSSEVWSSNTTSQAPAAIPAAPNSSNFGWGASSSNAKPAPTQVSADEDFGGWSSAPSATSPVTTTKPSKPAAGFTSDDLFSNVWE
ncbi:ARF GAP with effector function(s) [Coniosporium apollinis]|uniref:ARF GAP with effector function(S) n=2 Tax=Coniosporium TaxID=2810619 RepID=A0ABQ9NYY0_9PEZI|nr:ARF GAP with effector function(s) [Cladosporium sp. JES 115]KAJ9667332.1 ARF GAP with effector function(s) [Coniosporium apollinis]